MRSMFRRAIFYNYLFLFKKDKKKWHSHNIMAVPERYLIVSQYYRLMFKVPFTTLRAVSNSGTSTVLILAPSSLR